MLPRPLRPFQEGGPWVTWSILRRGAVGRVLVGEPSLPRHRPQPRLVLSSPGFCLIRAPTPHGESSVFAGSWAADPSALPPASACVSVVLICCHHNRRAPPFPQHSHPLLQLISSCQGWGQASTQGKDEKEQTGADTSGVCAVCQPQFSGLSPSPLAWP